MKRKHRLLLAALVVLAALWTVRYVTWNRYLKENYGLLDHQYFQMGETVELEEDYMSAYTALATGYSLVVQEVDILPYEDYCEKYGLEAVDGIDGEQVLELICSVSCDVSEQEGISFSDCQVHGANWYLNPEYQLLYQLYGSSLHVDDGDTVQVTIPFQISPVDADLVPAGQDGYFILTRFPVMKEIQFDWPT